MKRSVFLLLLLLILTLAACGKKPSEETLPAETVPATTVPETTVPAETEPQIEYVVAEINGIPAVMETLSRGDTLFIVEPFDEKHYVVKLDAGYGLVEKNLVRPEGVPDYEGWIGYAYSDAELYDNYRLAGNPAETLGINTKVEVVDDLGWCLLVSYDGSDGYMKPEKLARNPLGTHSAPEDSSTGQDGGDIVLQASGNLHLLSTISPQAGEISGLATVLADGTDVVLGYFDRDDRIPVIIGSSQNGRLTVYLEGLYAAVSDAYIRAEGEMPYTQWEGRCSSIAAIYGDRWMLGSPSDRLNANATLTVLQELEDCYLVQAEGVTGYIRKNFVMPAEADPGETEPKAPSRNNGGTQTPTPDTPTETPDTGNPEGSTAPSESKPPENPSGTGSGTPKPEWSPPVL